MSPLIKKTLLTTATLLALFTLYSVNINPDSYIKQQQWQENTIKAQRYLFGQKHKSVIVGSSLSAKLTDALPQYYNLAFSGQSVYDGLRVILEKTELPDTVFIEMNTLLVPENEAFTANITNPLLNLLRENIPAFREGKQPLPLVVKEMENLAQSLRGNGSQGANTGGSPRLFSELLATQVKKYSITPPAQTTQLALNRLRKYVNSLEAKKVTVVFFELPVHPGLCNLPLSVAIGDSFYTAFPDQKYLYIAKPDCAGYKTTDGIHFTASDAQKYARYFKTEVWALGMR